MSLDNTISKNFYGDPNRKSVIYWRAMVISFFAILDAAAKMKVIGNDHVNILMAWLVCSTLSCTPLYLVCSCKFNLRL